MERTVTVENPMVSDMAEVLTQNAEKQQQRSAEAETNRPSSLLRSLSFKYYIHDSVSTLRFQLIGDLRAANVVELNGSWETARTTLQGRRFVLDVSQVFSTDDDGRNWLRRMNDAGANFQPPNYLESAVRVLTRERSTQPAAAVKLSLLGRVMGMIRG
jgi:hypothetical protein